MLDITAGRVLVQGAGQTKLDTNDKLFHILTNNITGSVAIPTVTVTSPKVFSTTDYTLGSCDANCTHVIGAVKFTLNNYAAGMAFDRWHTYMGGVIVWVMDGEEGFASTAGTNFSPPRQIVTYEIVAESGTVKLRRKMGLRAMPSGSLGYNVLSHTIEYKLKAGLFT